LAQPQKRSCRRHLIAVKAEAAGARPPAASCLAKSFASAIASGVGLGVIAFILALTFLLPGVGEAALLARARAFLTLLPLALLLTLLALLTLLTLFTLLALLPLLTLFTLLARLLTAALLVLPAALLLLLTRLVGLLRRLLVTITHYGVPYVMWTTRKNGPEAAPFRSPNVCCEPDLS
jgi:hypothetical protein